MSAVPDHGRFASILKISHAGCCLCYAWPTSVRLWIRIRLALLQLWACKQTPTWLDKIMLLLQQCCGSVCPARLPNCNLLTSMIHRCHSWRISGKSPRPSFPYRQSPGHGNGTLGNTLDSRAVLYNSGSIPRVPLLARFVRVMCWPCYLRDHGHVVSFQYSYSNCSDDGPL